MIARRCFASLLHRCILAGGSLLVIAAASNAQSSASSTSPNDSIFRRARRMVREGNGPGGRALVDSLWRSAEEGTTAYGDALYWRGALAETAADAERAYRRVIVEYPLSYYSDDALLAIAELEQARGDRVAALQHLQRFVREHPASTGRAVAALAAARLAFEQHDLRVACAMMAEARSSAPATDVELVNQIDYFGLRCTAAPVTPEASTAATLVPAPTSSRRDSIGAVSQPAKRPAGENVGKASPPQKRGAGELGPGTAPPPTGVPSSTAEPARAKPREMYTLQLAAFKTRPEADRFLATLRTRGVTARVSGSTNLFRVRSNLYSTRQEALDELTALKKRGILGFVTTEARMQEPKSP